MYIFKLIDKIIAEILLFKKQYVYFFYCCYIVLVFSGIIFSYYLQLKFTHHKTKSKNIKLLQILIDSFFLPIVLFIIVQLISDKGNFFLQYLDDYIIAIIKKFKSISFVWMCWLGFARLIKNIEKTLIDDGIFKKTNDTTVITTITKMLTVFVYIIMSFMLMNIFGFKISKILAVVGGPAAIMIFAGKTAISDLLGGISMLMNKSFSIGEEIIIPEKNIEGKIMKIGLKKMTILTVERDILTVPNSILSHVAIINKTKTQLQQMKIEIPIENKYYKYVNQITEEIRKMLYTEQEINKTYNIVVFCNKFGINMSLVIEESFYIKLTNIERYKRIKQKFLLKSIELIDKIINKSE